MDQPWPPAARLWQPLHLFPGDADRDPHRPGAQRGPRPQRDHLRGRMMGRFTQNHPNRATSPQESGSYMVATLVAQLWR